MEPFDLSESCCLFVLQVIYVTRNPKDVLVSYYHFSKFIRTLEKIPDFNIFMERFLAGKGRIVLLLRSLNPTLWPPTEQGLIVVINISHPESSAILACNQSWSDCLSLALLSDSSWSIGGNTGKVCGSADRCKLLILSGVGIGLEYKHRD